MYCFVLFRYNKLLTPFVEVPNEGEGEYCVYQTYIIQADRRDELQQNLRDNGVEALIHYPRPLHLQPVTKYLGYTEKDFPGHLMKKHLQVKIHLFLILMVYD